MIGESHPEALKGATSAVSAGKRPTPGRRAPIDLRAKAETARRALRAGGIWGLVVKTIRVGESWVTRWGQRLWITRCVRRLWWTTRMRANEGVCSVEITTNYVGFFAQVNWCLFIFQYCERHGLIPDLRLTGETYLDRDRGLNWLEHYFDLSEPMTAEDIANRVRYTKRIYDFVQMGPPIAPDMSIDEGARLLHKYLRLKPHIHKMVEDLWAAFRIDGPVVGVHFRGTDKSTEAPRVSWQHCLKILEKYLSNHSTTRAVFVASDEQEFVDFIGQSITHIPVHSRDDHYRSLTNEKRPVFLKEGGGYEKGEDALVNALLLAKCSTLIRTTSFLSAWASIFNPELKVILLNKPYDKYLWYPEREILSARQTEYLPEL